MTVKEVAKFLGLEEVEIRKLCDKHMIDCCVVERPTQDEDSWGCFKIVKDYEIMPEEIEYLDWWFNYGGRKEYLSRVHRITHKPKNKNKVKMTITIEEI